MKKINNEEFKVSFGCKLIKVITKDEVEYINIEVNEEEVKHDIQSINR